jgi:hypothetical protein
LRSTSLNNIRPSSAFSTKISAIELYHACFSGNQDIPNESELVEKIHLSDDADVVVHTTLQTNEQVIARVTDGIYRQPASALRELISNAYDADAIFDSMKSMCRCVIYSNNGVLIAAGVTQFTRIPVDAVSLASDLVRPITAALDALYAEALGLPSLPAIDAMLTIRP